MQLQIPLGDFLRKFCTIFRLGTAFTSDGGFNSYVRQLKRGDWGGKMRARIALLQPPSQESRTYELNPPRPRKTSEPLQSARQQVGDWPSGDRVSVWTLGAILQKASMSLSACPNDLGAAGPNIRIATALSLNRADSIQRPQDGINRERVACQVRSFTQSDTPPGGGSSPVRAQGHAARTHFHGGKIEQGDS